MSLSLSVLSQSGPPKSVGGGGGSGVVYHTSTGQYIGVATFFFFFFKLDEKSIENGLEGQKFLVVCLFWGGCHHPNIAFVRGARDDYIFMSLVLFTISTTWFNDIDNNHSILSCYP